MKFKGKANCTNNHGYTPLLFLLLLIPCSPQPQPQPLNPDPYRQAPGPRTSAAAAPSSPISQHIPAALPKQHTFYLSQKLQRKNSGFSNVGTFNPQGNKLLTSDGSYLHVWFEQDGEFQLLQTFKYGFYIYNAAWSSDSQMFAVRYFYYLNIYRWSPIDNKFVIQQDIYVDADWFYDRNSLKFSRNDTLLMSAENVRVLVWERKGEEGGVFEMLQDIAIEEGKKTTCDIDEKGTRILCVNNQTYLFDFENGTFVESMFCKLPLQFGATPYRAVPEGKVAMFQNGNKALIGLGQIAYIYSIYPRQHNQPTRQQIQRNKTLERMFGSRCPAIGSVSSPMSSSVGSVSASADGNRLFVVRDHLMTTSARDRSLTWGQYEFTRYKMNSNLKCYGEISRDGTKLIVNWMDEEKKPEIWRIMEREPGVQLPQPGSFPVELMNVQSDSSVASWSKTYPNWGSNNQLVQFDLMS